MTDHRDTTADPDSLLFTDKKGNRGQLQDIIDDGLDGGYEARVPSLIHLQRHGDPYHQLLASVMLSSWGEPTGLQALTGWAREPQEAPWAHYPVTFDRISGADSAFELLADAVRTSFHSKDAESIRALQIDALKALLGVADSQYVGRTLTVAISRNPDVLAAVNPELRAAIDRGIASLRAKKQLPFDLATQIASLLTALAQLDDRAAAGSARALIEVVPNNHRMLRELAASLANGTGPDSLSVLRDLRQLGNGTLDEEINRALARRASA